MTDLKIVNAPAGSGKSTEIKKRVNAWAIEHPLDKLLCVTFTNRAADELTAGISSPNVEVSTIHSFMNDFSKSLFAAPEIVALYIEFYGERIKTRIENSENNKNVEESNSRYRAEFGEPLSLQAILDSISSLYYNERAFNTLYRGGLSHEDLLSFIAKCAKRYPLIYRRVNTKYQQIIIDEYQDTDVNVLEFFLEAAKQSGFALHLYGDRMQQIYKSDPARFQSLIQQFEPEQREVTNFRSTPEIVSLLNRIYNDESLNQVAHSEVSGTTPKVFIADKFRELEEQLQDDSTLILNIANATIYESIGALELLRSLQAMPEHGFNSRHSAVSVLAEVEWEKVQNPVIRLLYGLLELKAAYEAGRIGSVISTLRRYPKEFGMVTLHSHSDKAVLSRELESLFTLMDSENTTIRQVITHLGSMKFEKAPNVSDYFLVDDYVTVLDIPFEQVGNAFAFNQDPERSTQHGVKGESHEKVIFTAEHSNTSPAVHMKTLFNLWPEYDFSLQTLEDLRARLSDAFQKARENIGQDISNLKAAGFQPIKAVTTAEAERVKREFADSPLFIELYSEAYNKYLERPGITSAKKLFNLTRIEGLLSAYRLFYVGCSRAKSELNVIIPTSLLENIDASEAKLRELGFDVSRS
ncbi:UvrD-helicase domain-containing protein [Corynebacterium sp. J010B-136]|uniref:UvrD-helicase domain-containing protein n=1 Tax=Corynebacterium sp. J010B-136 TaxID=2099401 RepID=UPI000CFA79E7|nr:UvrD-helicase domain-containing protein [Corynebacterium sp. J010B-136]PQM75803.1 ATP-dependent helicase [Corynebacterium sp. J010B-136]